MASTELFGAGTARLDPARVAVGVAGVAGFLAGGASLGWAVGSAAGILLIAVQASTGVLSALFVVRGLRAEPRSLCDSAVTGALYGVLNAMTSVQLALLIMGSWEGLTMVGFVLLYGGPIGATYGVVYGAAYGRLLGIVHPHGRARKLASPDRAFLRMGFWLVVFGSVVLVLSPWNGAALVALGVLLAAYGGAGERRRVRILDRVRRGELPDFRILPPTNALGQDLFPFVTLHADEMPHVFARVQSGHYRHPPRLIPIGLVPASSALQ